MSLSRPAAGGESRKEGFLLISVSVCKDVKIVLEFISFIVDIYHK